MHKNSNADDRAMEIASSTASSTAGAHDADKQTSGVIAKLFTDDIPEGMKTNLDEDQTLARMPDPQTHDAGQHALDAFEHTQRRLDNLRSLVDKFGIDTPGTDGPRVA